MTTLLKLLSALMSLSLKLCASDNYYDVKRVKQYGVFANGISEAFVHFYKS